MASGEKKQVSGVGCQVSGGDAGFKIPDSIFKTAGSPYPRAALTGFGFLARRGAQGTGHRYPRYPEKRRKNVIKCASRLSEILILNVFSKFS